MSVEIISSNKNGVGGNGNQTVYRENNLYFD